MKLSRWRWLLTLTWCGLLARLVSVQLVNHHYFKALAEENRIRLVSVPADRGVIFDRAGRVLARNSPDGREYRLGPAAAAVLGYVAADGETIAGRDGLERQYDRRLGGRAGQVLLEVDAGGNPVRELGRSQPVAGDNLTTTLDAGLQQRAFALLSGRRGAVVVSDAASGGILALVSSPGFMPDRVARYLNDPDLPLFNRALGGVYPPGSTFKLVTAAAGLEEKVIDGETQIEDTGVVTIGDYRYANWYFTQYGRTEGRLNLTGAIKRSNDIFFYRLGEQLGIRRLADWAREFGLGRPTGIDLPGEAAGLVPDPEWKQAVKKESWFLGDTLIAAIGQGDILTTPLQVNAMTGVIAAGGSWCRPHLAGEADCRPAAVSAGTVARITAGMVEAARPGGTAWPFFNFQVNGRLLAVAGKTGTAEFGDPQERTHAWFTAFAPAGAPDFAGKPGIVVTVLLEGAGEGSAEAAPIAKAIMEDWFSGVSN